jgi:hypothetical protein
MRKINRIFIWLLATFGLLIIFFSGFYLIAISADPYKTALHFIDHNATLCGELGHLKSRRLSFFGYSVRYDGLEGNASYKISLTGEKCDGTVYVDLEKSIGQWQVSRANLVSDNGGIIPLFEGLHLKSEECK